MKTSEGAGRIDEAGTVRNAVTSGLDTAGRKQKQTGRKSDTAQPAAGKPVAMKAEHRGSQIDRGRFQGRRPFICSVQTRESGSGDGGKTEAGENCV